MNCAHYVHEFMEKVTFVKEVVSKNCDKKLRKLISRFNKESLSSFELFVNVKRSSLRPNENQILIVNKISASATRCWI